MLATKNCGSSIGFTPGGWFKSTGCHDGIHSYSSGVLVMFATLLPSAPIVKSLRSEPRKRSSFRQETRRGRRLDVGELRRIAAVGVDRPDGCAFTISSPVAAD